MKTKRLNSKDFLAMCDLLLNDKNKPKIDYRKAWKRPLTRGCEA